MERNYLDIEDLVRQARQQRSQELGNLISTAWHQCIQLLRGKRNANHPQTVLWRLLPP